ncbi:MAG: hypothetical protein HRT45_05250 [Bdellovibrionales bacterium]|nr:hypothetical protein [Bdellovibrionales bacterium]
MFRLVSVFSILLATPLASAMFCPIQEGAFQQNGSSYTYSECGQIDASGQLHQKSNYMLHTNDPGHPCDSVIVEFECKVTASDGFTRRIPLQSIVPASSNRPGPSCGQLNVNYDDACYFGSQAIFADLTHEAFCAEYVTQRINNGQTVDLNRRPTARGFVFEMAPGSQTE